MRTIFTIAFIIFFTNNIFSQLVDTETPENTQPENTNISGEWKLDFSDEFNGTELNTGKWYADNSTSSRAARPKIGINDWRWKPENVSVADGNLILEVHKTGTNAMTNGSVRSTNKYETQYGYFEVRLKIGEADKGTHTAFWLQSQNMGNIDGTANDGAEIDVFESAWTGEYTKSVVHIDGYGSSHQANTKQYSTPGIHSGFHTWGFHWTEYFMDIYYDGVFKVRYSDPKWVVKSPEFLWLSNGASFGLEGDQYFLDYPIGYLTQTEVDYIRVWKDLSTVDNGSLNQENWELISANTEDVYGNHLATYAFDGNPLTFWHSEWKDNQPPHPHEIQIDLGGTAKCTAFTYLPRQDNNPNGNVAEYQLFVSNDKENWGEAVATGTFANDGNKKTVEFSEEITCKYIKFVALTEVYGNNLSNAAEIGLIGEYTTAASIHSRNSKVDFGLELFPNPIENEINLSVENLKEKAVWKIYSLEGKLVKEGSLSAFETKTRIGTEELQSGSYFFEISNSKGKEVKLILKK